MVGIEVRRLRGSVPCMTDENQGCECFRIREVKYSRIATELAVANVSKGGYLSRSPETYCSIISGGNSGKPYAFPRV